jgi:hypothetical protein
MKAGLRRLLTDEMPGFGELFNPCRLSTIGMPTTFRLFGLLERPGAAKLLVTVSGGNGDASIFELLLFTLNTAVESFFQSSLW